MRIIFKITSLVILFSTPLFAQPFKITDIDSFFKAYTNQNKQPKRGEFETLEEYQKRLPQPYDSSKIVYFNIYANADIFDKNYTYDIDNQMLTFFGGKICLEKSSEYQTNDGIPINIYTNIYRNKEYEASNAYGKTVTVKELYGKFYVLNFLNISGLPDSIYDGAKNEFHLSIKKAPKEAEIISKTVSLIVCVQPINPKQSTFECTRTTKPTIEKPTAIATFLFWIDVKFKSLLLYDQDSKQVILRYDFY
jgi:hypothetical protein